MSSSLSTVTATAGAVCSPTSTTTATWNGATCPDCRRGYLGAHTCSVTDLQAQIRRLTERLVQIAAGPKPGFPQPGLPATPRTYEKRPCPCPPGTVCGSVLCGPQVIC